MVDVTAVFDIGKTNKKFFLFDSNFKEVHREYSRFEQIKDDDGYPCENLKDLSHWIRKVFENILKGEQFNVKAINFSTYGASLVHLDENGEPQTPLFDYNKPIDKNIESLFLKRYGPEQDLIKTTGTPLSGMLNSGLQLFWLKNTKPEIFKKIKYSLHLPQYLSYMFTGIPLSEYTSIGCHTLLWNFRKKDYHEWVYKEGINQKLAPIVSSETSINMNYNGKRIKIGVGIHDSSAALLPYVRSIKKKFILLSTGTWSIALNPFSKDTLNADPSGGKEMIHYMRINGKPVKSTRFFLGNEYKIQVDRLSKKYGVPENHHKYVEFNYEYYQQIMENFEYQFKWEGFHDEDMPNKTSIKYLGFEQAYHQLMIELVLLQVKHVKKVIGNDDIKKLYVDGGFSDNDLYIKILSHFLRNMELKTTNSSLGSALGAAIVIADKELNSKFLKKNYALKKHVPFVIK